MPAKFLKLNTVLTVWGKTDKSKRFRDRNKE